MSKKLRLEKKMAETHVDIEDVQVCSGCGEPIVSGDACVSHVYPNVVTVQCFACGDVYDVWTKVITYEKKRD